MRARGSRGAAIVDFVLVLAVLVPVFLGILQLALVLLVRNTLAAAASEGARYADDVDAHPVVIDGAPGIEVTVHAVVPALGLGGPGISLTVTGHAVEEEP